MSEHWRNALILAAIVYPLAILLVALLEGRWRRD